MYTTESTSAQSANTSSNNAELNNLRDLIVVFTVCASAGASRGGQWGLPPWGNFAPAALRDVQK